jgi:hypothetical protein
MDELAHKGVSRWSALKRIGAGAAIAWTASVLTSIRTPAFAQTAVCAPGCPECNFRSAMPELRGVCRHSHGMHLRERWVLYLSGPHLCDGRRL